IRRFELLPGYYLPWSDAQLHALAAAFFEIARTCEGAWLRGERLSLRNLSTRAPAPLLDTGFVVDAERRIHAAPLVLARAVSDRTVLGTLDDPPSTLALREAAARVPALLREVHSAHVLASTATLDRLLTALCDRLSPCRSRMRFVGRGGAPPATPPLVTGGPS
ncbi:MAG: hypothetical protein ACK4YP_23790, partial [Myxococcota bacterium]